MENRVVISENNTCKNISFKNSPFIYTLKPRGKKEKAILSHAFFCQNWTLKHFPNPAITIFSNGIFFVLSKEINKGGQDFGVPFSCLWIFRKFWYSS